HQLGLRGVQLLPRSRRIEPASTVHFRDRHATARPARPLDLDRVASDRTLVRITLEGPRLDLLARLLANGTEGYERSRRPDAGLLLELPDRRRERIRAWLDQPLGNRPRAKVTLRPEGPAGMRQEQLEPSRPSAEQQKSCAVRGGGHLGGSRRKVHRRARSPGPG